MGLVITVLVLLVIVVLLLYAIDQLAGLNVPPQGLIALKIIVILFVILYLLQFVGVFEPWRLR